MMTPSAHIILDELLAAIAQMDAVYSDAVVIPFGRDRVRQKVIATAARLTAEKAKPFDQVAKAWDGPWNGIKRS